MEAQLSKHVEKIVPVTDEEFDAVFVRFSGKRYSKHQFIVQESDLVKYNYFVVSALLKLVVYRRDP